MGRRPLRFAVPFRTMAVAVKAQYGPEVRWRAVSDLLNRMLPALTRLTSVEKRCGHTAATTQPLSHGTLLGWFGIVC